MNILLLSYSDVSGGAAIAASRINAALASGGACSSMRVACKDSDSAIVTNAQGPLARGERLLRSAAGKTLMRLQQSDNKILHSPAILPSGIVDYINSCSADIVNLHWICDEFISIRDIARIRKPIIWTLHDMWPFCGAEHYTDDGPSARWRVGYNKNNRPAAHKKLDIDRWTWNRKWRAWKQPMHILAPSNWLADCVRQSALMHGWPVNVVPNPIDVRVFQPWSKRLARDILNLPPSAPLILFGAFGGARDPRKGWDLLEAALPALTPRLTDAHCVIFGQSEPVDPPRIGLPLHWLGHLRDEISMALAYSAADVVVVPSRQDNLPQTGTEAQCCGCPVVAFACSGLPDVVEHGVTGYLAQPFDTQDLANGIHWVLSDITRHAELSAASRARAVRLWRSDIVASQYLNIYETAISRYRSNIG